MTENQTERMPMQIKLDGKAIEVALQKLVDIYPDKKPSIACNVEDGKIEFRAGAYRVDGGWNAEFASDPVSAADALIDKEREQRIISLRSEIARLEAELAEETATV